MPTELKSIGSEFYRGGHWTFNAAMLVPDSGRNAFGREVPQEVEYVECEANI